MPASRARPAAPAAAPATPAAYLDALPPERRAVVAAVRDVVLRHLPVGYEETVASRMLAYVVPLARYPTTYNGLPLPYVALAAQKAHYALYLTCAYQDPAEAAWLADAFARAGKRLDMGKSCLRFRAPDDLPLDAIGAMLARTPVERFLAQYEAARA